MMMNILSLSRNVWLMVAAFTCGGIGGGFTIVPTYGQLYNAAMSVIDLYDCYFHSHVIIHTGNTPKIKMMKK